MPSEDILTWFYKVLYVVSTIVKKWQPLNIRFISSCICSWRWPGQLFNLASSSLKMQITATVVRSFITGVLKLYHWYLNTVLRRRQLDSSNLVILTTVVTLKNHPSPSATISYPQLSFVTLNYQLSSSPTTCRSQMPPVTLNGHFRLLSPSAGSS